MNDRIYEAIPVKKAGAYTKIEGFKDNAFFCNTKEAVHQFGDSVWFVDRIWLDKADVILLEQAHTQPIPFDLDLYFTGDYDVVTGNGEAVEILTTSRRHPLFPIVALVSEKDGDESVLCFTHHGHITLADNITLSSDLMLLKREEKT